MDSASGTNCPPRPIESTQDAKRSNHQYQLSLDNFLSLFDQEDLFQQQQQGGIYPLAPQENYSAELNNSHNTAFNNNRDRALSCEDLLNLINEEVRELTAYNNGYNALPMQTSQLVTNALAFQQVLNEQQPPGSVYSCSSRPSYYQHAEKQPLSTMCYQNKPEHSMLPQGDMPPLFPVPEVFSQASNSMANSQQQQPMLVHIAQKNSAMSGDYTKADVPRRTCSFPNCLNRKVQGGLCISHGAKRKSCSHPGCDKHVKKAGLCSTHGPARKRCEVEGCTNVSVQRGRCIAHGAKKKACSIEECTKQGILGGMCKKHHDAVNGIVKVRAPRKKAKLVPS